MGSFSFGAVKGACVWCRMNNAVVAFCGLKKGFVLASFVLDRLRMKLGRMGAKLTLGGVCAGGAIGETCL